MTQWLLGLLGAAFLGALGIVARWFWQVWGTKTKRIAHILWRIDELMAAQLEFHNDALLMDRSTSEIINNIDIRLRAVEARQLGLPPPKEAIISGGHAPLLWGKWSGKT